MSFFDAVVHSFTTVATGVFLIMINLFLYFLKVYVAILFMILSALPFVVVQLINGQALRSLKTHK